MTSDMVKTDSELQCDVIDELDWEPSIDTAGIDVAVADGVVTLTGHVQSFAEQWTAEHVATCVAGVQVVANELEVRPPIESQRTDADIARVARSALEWDVWVPHHYVTVTVSDGWVMLDGKVDSQHQKLAAERVIRHLTGVKGMTNRITVKEQVQPIDVKAAIARAFQRSALVDAQHIQVETRDGKVILRGRVRLWAERVTTEQAVWAVPGVAVVVNLITIDP